MATDISKFSTAYKNIYNLLDRIRNRLIEEGDINYSRWKALGVTTTGSGASRVAKVASASSADKATRDGNGNVIASTYVSRNDASSVFPTADGNTTFSGNNTFTGANTVKNGGSMLFSNVSSSSNPVAGQSTDINLGFSGENTDGTAKTFDPFFTFPSTSNGDIGFGIRGGSGAISIGAGENAKRVVSNLQVNGSTESLYLSADTEICFISGNSNSEVSDSDVVKLKSRNISNLNTISGASLTLSGAATVGGAGTVNGALTVGGASTLNGVTTHNADIRALNSSNAETWRISRAGAVTGLTSVETSATVKGVKTVDGTKTTTWQLTNAGALTGITNLTISGALSCKNVDSSSGSTITRWALGSTGNASFTGTLTVTGNTTLNSALTVKGATTVAALTASGAVQGSGTSPKWSITAAGAASFASTLKVTGASTVAGLTASGTVKGSTDKWSITNAGAVTAVSYNSTSDRRLKTNIEERSFSPLLLDKLTPCEYSFKSDPEGVKHVGLIAQDVEAILPEAVREDENGYKSIDYSAVTAMLVGIIKEQDKKIAALTDIVDILVAKAFDGEADA